MDEIRSPQHVLNRIVQRWAARLVNMLEEKRRHKRPPSSPADGNYDPFDHRKFGGCWRGP
jgi:hypothetical protein